MYKYIIILFSILSTNCALGQFNSSIYQRCNNKELDAKLDTLRSLVNKDNQFITIEYSNKLIEYITTNKLTDCEQYYFVLLDHAKAYSRDMEFEKSINLFHKLLKDIDGKELHEIEAFCYIELELIHEFSSAWKECSKNLDIAWELIEKYNLKSVKPQYFARRSSLLRFQNEKPKAIELAKKAIKFGEEIDDKRNALDGYLLVGLISEDTEQAISYLTKAASMYAEFGDNISQAAQYIGIARLITLHEPRAWLYLDTAKTILDKNEIFNKEFYIVLSYFHSTKKHYFIDVSNVDSAYYYSELSYDAEKNAIISANDQKVALAEMEFDLEKAKNSLKEIKDEKSRLKIIISLGLLLISIMGLLSFLLFKNRQKVINQSSEIERKNNNLQALNEKNEMLLSEIHHRVKNNLQNIIGLMYMKQSKGVNPEIESFMNDISSKIYSMSLIHEQLYQDGEFEKIDMHNYLFSLVQKFNSILSKTQVKFDLDIEKVYLNIETTMPIGIIITEMITNSIKHNLNLKQVLIKIKFSKLKDTFTMTYQDNGKGIDENNKNTLGTGLQVIEGLTRQLRAKYIQENEAGYKATITFVEKQVSKI